MALLLLIAGNYQLRETVGTVKVTLDWRQSWTSQNLLQTTLASVPADTTHQPRSPVYAVRINVDWRLGSTFSLSPGLLLPPFNQLYWPLTPVAQQPAQSFTATFNKNLIGQDKLPVGNQVSALSTPPGPIYSNILRVWTQSLLQSTLIPPTALPPGEQVFDRTQPGPIQPLRDWSLNLLENTLAPVTPPDTTHLPRAPIYTNPREYPYHIQLRSWASTILPYATVVVQNPFSQTSWPLTPAAAQPDRSIAVAYNPNLVGKDQLPVGARFTDLWTKTPESPTQTRSWVWSYNLNLVGKDQLPVGDISTALTTKPYEYHAQLRSWAWMYNLNLVGKDQLPAGEIIYDRPPLAQAGLFQTWTSSLNLSLVTIPVFPFYQTSWPLTPAAQQPERTITASYNQNLIGQDNLPFRQTDWPLTPPAGRVNDLLTWILRTNLMLLLRPFAQLDWPVPYGPRQPAQSFTGSYNLNLIGQDQLPVGSKVSDIPPQPPLSAIQLRTWIQSVNLALTVTPPALPFNQYDWPVNPGPRQPTSVFVGFYNPNLVGKDQLPVGETVSDLPPQPARQPTQVFVASYNKNLVGKDKLPTGKNVYDLPPRGPAPLVQVWLQGFNLLRQGIFVQPPLNQYDWPNPRGAWDGKDRTIAFRSQLLPPTPPPPQFPNVEAPLVRDYWDRDEWGNFIKGYCVRGT